VLSVYRKIIKAPRRSPMKNIFRITCAFMFLTNTVLAQDQPTIAKDSIQITAFTFNVYKGNYDEID
jgi:hypothetical protein